MHKPTLLLCIIAIAFCLGNTDVIDCPVNKQRIYHYESVIHSFGGTQKVDGHINDNSESTKGERSVISASVAVTCVKAMHYRAEGNTLYLMHFRVKNVNMNMTLDSKNGWRKLYEKPASATPNYDHLFGEFTAFTMSAKGKIYKVFHAKNEQSWVTAMKKSIIAQLQVKYGNTERVEKDGVGPHVVHYKSKPQKDGSLVVEKEFSDADVPKENTKAKRKQMRLTSKSQALVDKKGRIQAVMKHEKIVLGTHHHQKKHPGFFSLRNVPFKNSTHFGTGNDMWLNADERTELVYEKTVPFNDSIEKHMKRNKADNEVMSSHEEFELHDEIVQSDLAIDERTLFGMSKATRKSMLHSQYNCTALLETLTENPDDVLASSVLAEFVQLDENILDLIFQKFSAVAKKHDLTHGFLRVAQSLLAIANSTKAQEYLIKTLKSEGLTMHAIMKAVHMPMVSEAILTVLQHYADQMKKHNFAEAPKNAIPMNAFLILSALVNKIPEAKKQQILETIVRELTNADSIGKVLFYIHALGNAGSASPLLPLKKLIFEKTAPLAVKIAATEALRKRDDMEEDDQVTGLIHKIVSSKKCHNLVKLAAIKSQTTREENLANGASVSFFKRYLLNKRTPQEIKKALSEYYETNGSDESGDILLKSQIAAFLSDEEIEWNEFEDVIENLADAKFLGKVGQFFSNVGQAIGNGVQAVGQGISNVVQNVGNAIGGTAAKVKETFDKVREAFATATFNNNQVCVPASRAPNDRLCVYDQDMANFLASQGDMSNHNIAAHFAYERLIGANKLNLYVGALGVCGTNFNCADAPSTFEFVVAGRMEAKAQIFDKQYKIITGHLIARQKAGVYYDKVFLKILDNVVVDQGLLPQDKIRLCQAYTKPIWNKDFNNLPGVDMTVMLGPIPLVFGFQIVANARLDASASYCFNDLTAKAGIEPAVSLGVSGYAAVGIPIAKAGIRVTATFNYALQPNVNARGLQCKVCAQIDQVVRPMAVNVKAFADVNLGIVNFGGEKELFNWNMPADTRPLFQRCLDIPRLLGFRRDDMTYLQ